MNKHLLLGCALIAAISVYPQQKQISKSGFMVKPIPTFGVQKEGMGNVDVNAYSGSTISNPVATPPSKTSKGLATLAVQRISGSCNVFGMIVSEQRPLSYNPALNAVCFVHRASPTYTIGVANGNTGTQAAWISQNSGSTWDSTLIWADASNFARYPQGGIYNFPANNSNIANAYVVAMGPITNNTNWIGNWYTSKKLNAYNKTAPADMQPKINATAQASMNVHQFSRISFNSTDDGLVRGIATLMGDPAGTTYVAQALRGAGIVKGTFNAGAFIWTMDSLIPSTGLRSDGSKLLDFAPVMAFSESGQYGYIVFYGVTSATTTASQNNFQPIVYKTSNYGAAWSLMPAIDWTTPTFARLVNNIWPISSNTNITIPKFTTQEGHGAVVDVNNNLHLVTTVLGTAINHPDSLNYYIPFSANKYQWQHVNNGFPYIYDFVSDPVGGWKGILVDSMGTEGPGGGTLANSVPGYTASTWSDQTTNATDRMDLDARIQVARSANGRQIFYSWTETDTTATSHHWNIFPDIKTKAWDVTVDKMTPRYNVTTGTGLKTDQLAYWHYMSNKVIQTNLCGSYEIPFTVTNNLAKRGDVPVDHYYIKGFVIPCAAYTSSSTPLGIDEKKDSKTTTSSFDVNVYPNPATDAVATISVNLKESKTFEINVYNQVGQLLQNIKLNGTQGVNEVDLDLTKFSAGVYMYSVKVDNAVTTKKLIVE